MAWSPNFTMALTHAPVKPKFVLQFLPMPYFIGSGLKIAGGYSQGDYPAIKDGGPSIRGTSIIPQTWNVSFGGFTVPIVGNIRKLFPMIRKGSLAELWADINGKIERVAIGQLRNIRGFGKSWNLEFIDLISAMQSRTDARKGTNATGGDPDKFTLFNTLGIEVNLTSNWSPSSSASNPISVDDVRPFQLETGEYGLARCVDSSGNEFYIEYSSAITTSAPAGVLNLAYAHTSSTIVYPSLNACSHLSSSTAKIYSAAQLKGKPYDIFGKILLSRNGSGVNTLDKYPSSYNFGANLNESILDRGDIQAQKYIKSSAPATTDYKWHYILTAPLTNGIRTIVDTAALTGQWPTWRQNSITWRGCQKPEDATYTAAKIDDSNIIQINNIDIFDPNNKSTFFRSRTIYGINSSSTILANMKDGTGAQIEYFPAESYKQRDLRFVYGYNPNTAPTDRLRCSIGDINRLFEWDTRVWTKISIRVQLKFAKLTSGDIIEIKSNYLSTFMPTNVKKIWHRGMILSCDWNFLNSYCSLSIAILI
tara:strand:+ start:269 stop:1873 length:1605 start_codon:yes stop_codon:yes gene_type:complete